MLTVSTDVSKFYHKNKIRCVQGEETAGDDFKTVASPGLGILFKTIDSY
jgi:hypothetical protein